MGTDEQVKAVLDAGFLDTALALLRSEEEPSDYVRFHTMMCLRNITGSESKEDLAYENVRGRSFACLFVICG